MAKIIIIDGNSLLFRGFYATYSPDPSKIMKNSEGIPTNAIFAFSNMIASFLKDLKKGDGIFVAFDSGKHTFRHKEYSEYKSNRPPCPEDLLKQMPIARELLNSLNIIHYESEEIEADDIAGNIAKKAEKEGFNVEIYTSDKDYLQLIDNNITVKLIKKGLKDIKEMTPQTFFEEWGFEPIKIVDYKGLMGDPSDNLKGIPKVGEITAKKLIKEYGTLENIIDNAPNFKTKIGQSIIENQENGRLCKHLAFIKTDDNLPLEINDLIYKGYNLNDINKFASKYSLRTLLNKLPISLRIISNKDFKVSYKQIKETSNLKFENGFSFEIDSSNDNYHIAEMYGILICVNNDVFYLSKEDFLNDKNLISNLENEKIPKFCYDFKRNKYILSKLNINVNGLYFDLLLASYLLDSNLKPNPEQVLSYFGVDVSYAIKDNNLLFDLSNPLMSAIIAFYSLHLSDEIIKKLKEKEQYDLLINIEQPLSYVLHDMEYEGFPIEEAYLQQIRQIYVDKIKLIEEDIYELAGEKFNVSSPKQVKSIIYDKLKLNSFNNKKNSTSVDFLKELINSHPIISKILEYRKYTKLLTTYIDGIIPYIHEDKKIHATFNQALTTTGRLSSSEPNLQNISIKDEESKQIRKAFHYEDENLNILSFDYSQIELRLLAHLSNSKTLIDAFNNDEDIHTLTAKKVFKIEGEVDSLSRRKAKAINFGIVYGISDWGLSEQIGVSVKEAKEIIENFYNEFPEIKSYLNNLIEYATTKGYAQTMFNRRRYIPEISSNDYPLKEFGKRAAMNAPIQGSAADLIKIAMIQVHKALKENNLNAKIINQIHDEIILKVDDGEKEKVYDLVKNVMENCVKLKVKLKVDGEYAKNWYDAK